MGAPRGLLAASPLLTLFLLTHQNNPSVKGNSQSSLPSRSAFWGENAEIPYCWLSALRLREVLDFPMVSHIHTELKWSQTSCFSEQFSRYLEHIVHAAAELCLCHQHGPRHQLIHRQLCKQRADPSAPCAAAARQQSSPAFPPSKRGN